jgi:Glycosyl transferase family 2
VVGQLRTEDAVCVLQAPICDGEHRCRAATVWARAADTAERLEPASLARSRFARRRADGGQSERSRRSEMPSIAPLSYIFTLYTAAMLNNRRIGVVLPAYNAEATLARTLAELDRSVIDEVVLVDDASTDQTVELARRLGLEPIRHEHNLGYGGNQKTCYRRVLELGADVIVMVHPDYQYSPLLVPAMASMIAYGEYDLVLGSRILAQDSVARGMPRYKYAANRALTLVENFVLHQKLSEYHTGLRAFSRPLLAGLPFERNSDGFVFDNQIIAQAIAAGARIGELSCPTRYQADSSSIDLRGSIRYGLGVLRTCAEYRLRKSGLRRCAYLDFDHASVLVRFPAADDTTEPAAESSVSALKEG